MVAVTPASMVTEDAFPALSDACSCGSWSRRGAGTTRDRTGSPRGVRDASGTTRPLYADDAVGQPSRWMDDERGEAEMHSTIASNGADLRANSRQRLASEFFEQRVVREARSIIKSLEVGPGAERVEIRVAPHPGAVAIPGGDGPAQDLHRPVQLGRAFFGRQTRARRAGDPAEQGMATGQVVKGLAIVGSQARRRSRPPAAKSPPHRRSGRRRAGWPRGPSGPAPASPDPW